MLYSLQSLQKIIILKKKRNGHVLYETKELHIEAIRNALKKTDF